MPFKRCRATTSSGNGHSVTAIHGQTTTKIMLEQVREGATPVDAALEHLRHLHFEDLGFAKVDRRRALRHGIPR